jgi:AcrR family transcriptional regulator
MARPRTFEDAELLQFARREFLKHGIAGSTKEIARRAGVSEAGLFKRFRTKHALFIAAMMPPRVGGPKMVGCPPSPPLEIA